MKEYAAPWGKLLTVMSIFATVVCVGVAVAVMIGSLSEPESATTMRLAALLPVAIIAFAALTRVRGYAITGDEIIVQRPLGSRHFERARLQSAAVDPAALHRSIRLFGNGGFFSFSGVFGSPKLGRYRAYVTDPSRAVVLRFADRVVVISPSDPAAFVRDVTPGR